MNHRSIIKLLLVVLGTLVTTLLNAQGVKIKIPIILVDSVFNSSDSSLNKVRTSTLTFGVHPNATRCVDFPLVFDSFMTHWTIIDPGIVKETRDFPDPSTNERFAWDLTGCLDALMFYDNITFFNDSNDRDTFRLDIGFITDTSLYHYASLSWPHVLGEYFDTCALIRNFGLGTQSTQADMRSTFSFVIPSVQTPPSSTVRYVIYIHGLKTPPGPPATLSALLPANGDTGIDLSPTLSWSIPAQGAYYYGLQVSTDPGFNSFLFNDTLSINSVQLHSLQPATTYYWRIYVQNQYGASYFQDTAFYFMTTVTSDVSLNGSEVPASFKLNQNYPNPFNPTTKISFEVLHSSFVTLTVFNVFGREVASIINKPMTPGSYAHEWNASDIASGVYYYRFTVRPINGGQTSFTQVKKMLLIK